MLNHDSLAQLKGLKSQMEAEKERAEAVIKGTQARYGFAVLDDGREIFIPPDEMLKVFPDDRVRVCIRPAGDNKKTIADIEKLLDSPLSDFTGRCVRKAKALFVQPDLPQLKRWLFIPPHARNGVKEGDYVRCAILRHPIRDGKPQAKILQVLGNDDTPGIENSYCMGKYRLGVSWSPAAQQELEQQLATCRPLETERRRDLTDLEFISIDAAKTQDIDDALYADISSDGWTLYVAIADPTAYIAPGSRLLEDIASRGTSIYFHGDVLPMMPEVLAQDTCALSEGNDRPALVCKIAVSDSGKVGDFDFIEATVRSRAKLSYYAVDRYLNGHGDELMSHATPLEALYQVYRALRGQREQDELVMEDRREFRWILNDRKQIESIEPHDKLLSQKLVEECMIAANRCAARFLAERDSSGPFVIHPGFRKDRLEEVRKFLALHAPAAAELDPTTREGYRDIMRQLARQPPAPARHGQPAADPRRTDHPGRPAHGHGAGVLYQLHLATAQVRGFPGSPADQGSAARRCGATGHRGTTGRAAGPPGHGPRRHAGGGTLAGRQVSGTTGPHSQRRLPGQDRACQQLRVYRAAGRLRAGGLRGPAQGPGKVQLRQVDRQPHQYHPPFPAGAAGRGRLCRQRQREPVSIPVHPARRYRPEAGQAGRGQCTRRLNVL